MCVSWCMWVEVSGNRRGSPAADETADQRLLPLYRRHPCPGGAGMFTLNPALRTSSALQEENTRTDILSVLSHDMTLTIYFSFLVKVLLDKLAPSRIPCQLDRICNCSLLLLSHIWLCLTMSECLLADHRELRSTSEKDFIISGNYY